MASTKFKVKIDISKNTENEALVTGVTVKEAGTGKTYPLPQISVPNMYMKFSQKALAILSSLANNKRFFYSYNIAMLKPTDDSDKSIAIHVIRNKDGCTELFEPLRRLGLILSELRIGLSHDHKKIYLTNKVLRDLSKFSTSVQEEVVMYFTSVAYLFSSICDTIPELNCVYGGNLETDITDWNRYIYSFKADQEITAVEIPIDDLKAIRYINNPYSTPPRISSGYADSGFVIASTNGARTMVIQREIVDKTFWVYSPVKKAVYTNNTLTHMDLDYDTTAAGFTHAIGYSIDIIYREDIKSLYAPDKEHIVSTSLEPDDFVEDLIFEKIALHYKSQAGIPKAKLNNLFTNYKACAGLVDKEAIVEQYKDDEYAQQLYTQVQDYYEDFDLKSLKNSVRGFANGDIYAMMFIGESGTGKSTAARVIPYRCGLPYVSINFCVNIEESDLIGTMIPNPEKQSADDPEFIWQDGIITKAVRNGYTVVLEEINFARPGVLGKLNSLLDENRQIDLPNGEILKAHKNFRMIATCNIAYEGTNRFNKALINRFEVVHEFKDLEKAEAFKAIKERIKGVDDTKLSTIYTVYELLKKYAKEQGLDIVVSIRQLFNVFRQGKYYVNAYDAVMDIIINGAFVELPEYKDNFVTTLADTSIKGKLSFKI